MRTIRTVVVLTALQISVVASSAQVLERPPRPESTRPSGRVGRTSASPFTLRLNVLGGWDDNLAATGGNLVAPTSSSLSGYQGFSDVTFGYALVRPTKSLNASARGLVATNRDITLDPTYGTGGDVGARTMLGRRTELSGSAEYRYDRYFSLGSWSAPGSGPIPSLPAANPTNSMVQRRTISTQSVASISRQWTRDSTTDLSYAYSRQRYPDNNGYAGATHTAVANWDLAMGEGSGVAAGYEQSVSRFEDFTGVTYPTLAATIHVGLRYARDLSPTRRFSVSGGGGASYVDTVQGITRAPLEYWSPSGYGTVSMGIGRSWSASGTYRRAPTMLHASTTQTFMSDSASITVGGLFTRRTQGVFSVGYSNGVTDPGQVGLAPNGRYSAYSGTAQLQFELTPWWSALGSYTHYSHHANVAASVGLAVYPELNRDAVRFGFSWSFPPPSGRTSTRE